jgi:hypothetical protein
VVRLAPIASQPKQLAREQSENRTQDCAGNPALRENSAFPHDVLR